MITKLKDNHLYRVTGATMIFSDVAIYRDPGSWIGLYSDGSMGWDIGLTAVKELCEIRIHKNKDGIEGAEDKEARKEKELDLLERYNLNKLK